MTNNNPHIGSSFDEFLDEENLLGEANEIAIKKVIDWYRSWYVQFSNSIAKYHFKGDRINAEKRYY